MYIAGIPNYYLIPNNRYIYLVKRDVIFECRPFYKVGSHQHQVAFFIIVHWHLKPITNFENSYQKCSSMSTIHQINMKKYRNSTPVYSLCRGKLAYETEFKLRLKLSFNSA